MHQPIVSSMAWLVSGALLGSFVFPFCPNECHLPSTETTAKLESELQTLLQKARHGQVRRDVLITTAAEHQKESSKILTRQLDVCGQNVQQLRTELAAAKKPYSECLQLPECRHQRNSPENAWYPQPLSNPLFLRGDIPTNPSNIEPDGISLATHLSADRLQALTQLCTTWPLNISAAVYAMDDADLEKVNDWCQSDTGCNCADTGTLNRIQLQVLKADQLSKSYRGLYPVNSLRNRALIGVRTKHTLGIDADFLVGGDVGNMPQPDDKTIYLLPCFKVEADKYPQGKPWPVTKAQLLEWYSNGWVSAYGEMKDWPLGHMDVRWIAKLYDLALFGVLSAVSCVAVVCDSFSLTELSRSTIPIGMVQRPGPCIQPTLPTFISSRISLVRPNRCRCTTSGIVGMERETRRCTST
eukprot:m.1036335 g.1036335  ORF g.1036335 m.1036335 type:complete len:412 (+) comp24139_c2_seq17:262-1497(+)